MPPSAGRWPRSTWPPSTRTGFYEPADEAGFEHGLELEFGVLAAVCALCAGENATFAFCGGHGYVVPATDAARARCSADGGCGLDADERGLVEARAPYSRKVIELTAAPLRRHDAFDLLPGPFPACGVG